MKLEITQFTNGVYGVLNASGHMVPAANIEQMLTLVAQAFTAQAAVFGGQSVKSVTVLYDEGASNAFNAASVDTTAALHSPPSQKALPGGTR